MSFTAYLQMPDNASPKRDYLWRAIKETMNTKMNGLLLALSVCVTSLCASENDFALDKALESPRSDFLQSAPVASLTLSNLEFRLHPVYMLDHKGRTHTLAGTIEHTAANGTNHTVLFRILKHKGAIKDVQLQVDYGTPQSMSAPMMKALGKYLETGSVYQEDRKAINVALQEAADGTWLSLIELLVAQLGIKHC
jgi:hypothetical protein